MHPALTPSMAGFAFGLSLIVAIGAQNAFVLRQGIARRHVLAVVTVCATSDVILITAGVAGAGLVVGTNPGLLQFAYWGGAAFLLTYAALSARRAMRNTSLEVENTAHTKQLGTAIVTALALTWLNPHVYLDTVVLLGSVAATYDTTRLWFSVGAAVASLAWFSALGYGAQFLRPLFSRPASWRVLDGAIAVFMLCLALTLAIQAIS